MIKLEEGKYYRTADGKKVGPVRIAETHIPDKWALWSNDGKIYEVVGVPCEEAFDTQIVAEWVDHYHVVDRSEFNPKPWGDMTPEEKCALLLAHHEGKVIECWNVEEWCAIDVPYWFDNCAYRVRPEPVRETKICYWNGYNIHRGNNKDRTHRITFDLVDGEPDCTSIRMERIDD